MVHATAAAAFVVIASSMLLAALHFHRLYHEAHVRASNASAISRADAQAVSVNNQRTGQLQIAVCAVALVVIGIAVKTKSGFWLVGAVACCAIAAAAVVTTGILY
jgi:hypothetical protein